METAIIDYGMGNLLSVQRAFEKCNSEAVIVNRPELLYDADRIVLPGVGAFSDAMNNLTQNGWADVVRDIALNTDIPLLGICLGMQLLADRSYEMGETEGLGLIPGEVRRFTVEDSSFKIPHVGWNDICIKNDHCIMEDIKSGTNYYFVHSYHYITANEADVVATADYGYAFAAVVANDNIVGVQFHPEKSQKAGFALIRNFISM